jgi:hypothetical protein
MKRFGLSLLPALLAIATTVLGAVSAKANVTYEYTGLNFEGISGSCTTSDSVTGSVTFSAPLTDNLSLASVIPASFSFSDGLQTLTNTNPNFTLSLFQFSTDGTGQITGWNIELETWTPSLGVFSITLSLLLIFLLPMRTMT